MAIFNTTFTFILWKKTASAMAKGRKKHQMSYFKKGHRYIIIMQKVKETLRRSKHILGVLDLPRQNVISLSHSLHGSYRYQMKRDVLDPARFHGQGVARKNQYAASTWKKGTALPMN